MKSGARVPFTRPDSSRRSENHLEFHGAKVKLRPVDDSDIDDLYNWWNDSEFSGEYAADSPKSRAEVEKLVKGGC